ncbi:PspC domain-containing protein [Mucilaginibacter sp. L196]|uniref:PspC domain-containing protein n=1 Tax=Mucilaginibacter sp. L196 TaxID=1641870 RepID=UPI00131D2748|nr:PspC domain-containing protein [Mucilaginibacter sp. L196]
MNKTIIININGIVFHIEEDAYEILKNYMTDVKRHFSNSADSLEITTDIENRVAEMFNELLANENKQVIVEQDVHTVIEQMGRVEDFENLDDETAAANTQYTYDTGTRRLFRDPDDHLVSGVCAGIANYFDIQPLWIRLAFALSFFFAGSGLLLYIILWIVIPQATTRADRMAMKGQKLNLQGFKDNLEEELSSVRNHLNNLHQEARPTIYKMRDFIGDLLLHIHLFFMGAGKIIIKIIGFAVLLVFFGFAIALIAMLVAIIGFHSGPQGLFPFSIIANEHADRIYFVAFVAAFIPVVTIIIVIITALFNTKAINRSIAATLLVVWLCSLGLLIGFAVNVASHFRSSGKISQVTNLKATPDNVYYLKLNDVKYLTHDDSLRLNIKGNFNGMIIKNDDNEYDEPRNVNINIQRSDVSHPVLIETFIAQGSDDADALLNARNTTYLFLQQDSVIKFDDKLRRVENAAWHDEHLDITLQIPLNAKVIIDQDLNNNINLDGISVNDCKNINKQDNATSATFIMMDNGLQCKIDTVVTIKTKAQIDSARRMENAKTIAQLQAQVDSARTADSVQKKK